MKVEPSESVLIFQALLGQAATQQLTVTLDLPDEPPVDVTSDPGTNYKSSDLSICDFDLVQPGLVIGVQDGECIITVTNSGLAAEATVNVIVFTPLFITSLNMPDSARDVEIRGDFAYIALNSDGLQIVDISDRKSPGQRGF